MKQKRLLFDIVIQALLGLYVFGLFKVILFKFGTMDVPFLYRQLRRNLANPHYIASRLNEGNLIPFHEISKSFHVFSSHLLYNLLGNIVIFIPYGILLGLLSINKRKLSFVDALLCSFGLSLCLECAQTVFSIGIFDVDDLILNSCGGLIGWIAFRLCAKFKVAVPNSLTKPSES